MLSLVKIRMGAAKKLFFCMCLGFCSLNFIPKITFISWCYVSEIDTHFHRFLNIQNLSIAYALVDEKKIPEENKTKNQSFGWLVQGNFSNLQVLLPNQMSFEDAQPKQSYPDGTKFFLQKGSSTVTVVHSTGISMELASGSLWVANSKQFESSRRHERMAVDVLEIPPPTKPGGADEKVPLPLVETLLGFFVPRIPQELIDLPKETKSRNVIKIIFPGQVHGVETPSLPGVVRFEWDVGKGQKEPHALYLWPEGTSSANPLVVTSGGQATVPIPKYGRFFWQVEDASGRFISAPRTLTVRPLATPNEKTTTLTAQESRKGGFRLLFPDPSTHVFGCLNENKPLVVPIKIPVLNDKTFSYRLEILPKNGWETEEIFVPPGSRYVLGKMRFWRAGGYRIRAFAKHQHSKELASDFSLLQVNKMCISGQPQEGNKSDLDFEILDKVFASLNKGQGFPDRGALVFE